MSKKVFDDFDLPGEGDIIDQVASGVERSRRQKDEVTLLKEKTDMVSFLSWLGLTGKENGKGWMYHCPLHDDKTPSLSVDRIKGVWHCFGCQKSGDVIGFIEEYKRTDFKSALSLLREYNGVNTTNKPQALKKKPEVLVEEPLSAEEAAELNRLELMVFAEYGMELFEEEGGINYFKSRGLTDAVLLKQHHAGYCSGKRLLPKLSQNQKKLLTRSGFILKNGRERFSGYIVIGVFGEDGSLGEVYGRRIGDGEPKHQYLPGPHAGVFNPEGIRIYSERVIIAESFLDALSLIQIGFNGVTACFGKEGFTPDMLKALTDVGVREVVIGFDSDDAGKLGAEKLSDRLSSIGFTVKKIFPPSGKDWNDCLLAGIGKEAIEELIVKSEPAGSADSQTLDQTKTEKDETDEDGLVSKNKHEIVMRFERRIYRISRFSLKSLNDFSMTLKIVFEKGFYLSEVNLGKSLSRSSFAKEVREALNISEETVKDDLFKIMEKMEELQRDHIEKKEEESFGDVVFTMSREEEWEAKRLLSTRDVLTTDLMADTEILGYVGEEINKYAWYLAITSRKLSEPLNILSLGQSAGGKSMGQETILKFTPDEDLKRYSKITPKALFYYGRYGLSHKVVAIDEIAGIEEAMYALRTLLSSGYLTSSYPRIDPKTGQLQTFERRVEGPISCFLSSTNLDLVDFETKSRFLVTGNDETREQTKRIVRLQYKNASRKERPLLAERQSIIRKYKCIQKVLEPLEVRMPEEWNAAVDIKGERLGSRRLNKNYISLIKSITLHRQFLYETFEEDDAKTKRVCVYMRKEDVELANRIGRVLFSNTISDLLPPARTLLLSVYDMCESKSKGTKLSLNEIVFTKREIIECSKMSEWQVRHYMADLVNLEYVTLVRGRKGLRFAYRLLNTGRITGEEDFDFIDPERL